MDWGAYLGFPYVNNIFIHKKRRVLVSIFLLFFLNGVSRPLMAQQTILNFTYTVPPLFSNIYLDYHNNHFYFRVLDSYIYLPGVSNPAWLLWTLTQKSLQTLTIGFSKALVGPLSVFAEEERTKEDLLRIQKKTICRSRRVSWEPGELNLNGLLSIYTSCLDEKPVWLFNAAPPRSLNDIEYRIMDGDESVFYHL